MKLFLDSINVSGRISRVPRKRGRPKGEKRVKADFYIKPVVLTLIDEAAKAGNSSRGKVVEAKFQTK